MLKKLLGLNPFLKVVLSLVFFVVSYFTLQIENIEFVGYISMFLALATVFEGYGFKLITKILIALV